MMASQEYRTEHDSMGEVRVPADRYWGAQTEFIFLVVQVKGLEPPLRRN